MKHFYLPVAALLLSSTTAFAQLAPQDVMAWWRGFYAGFGATINTRPPEVSGDTTRYASVFAQMNIAGSEARYSFDWIDMQKNPDGSLDITFSPDGFATTFAETDGTTVESRITYDLGALTIHAEGQPNDILFTYDAPVLTAHQSQKMPGVDVSMTLALEGLQGEIRSRLGAAGLISEDGALDIAVLSAKVAFTPENTPPTGADFSSEAVSLRYDLSLPSTPAPTAPITMLFPENLVFGYTMATGPATTTITQTTDNIKGQFTFSHTSGEVTLAFAEGAARYGVTANEATLGLANTPARPVDFTAAFERFHFGTTIPVLKSNTPAPFALAFALERFTLDDRIWAKIDPETTLSRAPASFAFSLNGTAKLFADIFDRTALTTLRGAPFELRSLSLDTLRLDFEGMGLTGNGDVTFNNERKDPSSGLPEPTGALDFSITGALGMLDKIGRLGLMEPMVIIGAKGALGMFATPADGPDSFTSRIEFTEGGHVSVNGQQVK